MRQIPAQRELDVGRPGQRRRAQRARRRRRSAPIRPARVGRRHEGLQRRRRDRPPRPSHRAAACAVTGPMPGISCATRKPAMRPRGFWAKRSTASRSLTCAASRNLRPPNLTKGMLRRASSSSSAALWLRGAEQHRLRLQRRARLRGAPAPGRPPSAPAAPRRAPAPAAAGRPRACRSTASWRGARAAAAITAFEASRIGCVER